MRLDCSIANDKFERLLNKVLEEDKEFFVRDRSYGHVKILSNFFLVWYFKSFILG